jgi:predicted Ser/Thr protein kinase
MKIRFSREEQRAYLDRVNGIQERAVLASNREVRAAIVMGHREIDQHVMRCHALMTVARPAGGYPLILADDPR